MRFTILSRDADQWLVREYRKDKQVLILSLVATLDQRKLFRVHIPDICLPAQGWAVKERATQTLGLSSETSVLVTSLLTEKDNLSAQVLYWFTSDQHVVANKILHRLLLVWDGIVGDRTPGVLYELTGLLAPRDRSSCTF